MPIANFLALLRVREKVTGSLRSHRCPRREKTELGFSYRTCLEPDFGSKNRVSLHLLFSVVHFMVLFKGMSPGPESLESVNLNTVT